MAVMQAANPPRAENADHLSVRTLLDAQAELLCHFEIDGRILFVNAAYAAAFGAPADRLVGSNLFDLIPPAEREGVREALRGLRRERVEVVTEHLTITPAGERWMSWRNRALSFDAAGRAATALSSGADVTDRKRAEDALRESDRRLRESDATLRAFYESSPVCMGITELLDDETDILHIYDNPATCRFFGVAPGGTIGRRARHDLRADERIIARWTQAYRAAAASGAPVRLEHAYDTPRGTQWLAATVSAIGAGPSGRMRFSYVAEDVTHSRNAEAALRDSEQRLRLALEAGRMGTWEWNIPAARVTWSPGLEAIHGYDPGTFPGTVEAYAAEVHPDDKSYVEGVIAQTFSGHEHHIEYRIVRRDGAVRWVEGRGKLFRDAEGNPARLVGVCTDVTSRKEAENRLRESEARHRMLAEALRQADRRKDEFLATLAHELRNPLAPLRNGVELLQRMTGDRRDVATVCGMMERQVRHMVRLVDDLLDVSRITRGAVNLRMERVELAEVLEAAVEATRPALEAREHRLTVSLSAARPAVRGDSTRLTQVFANLLNNAAKFTPPGGSIDVRMAVEDEHASVAIADNGVGIEPAMLERVFELFAQLEDPMQKTQQGLGIGLTLARQLVELHGGTLAAASEGVGRGSTFTVRLPLAAAPRNLAAPAAP